MKFPLLLLALVPGIIAVRSSDLRCDKDLRQWGTQKCETSRDRAFGWHSDSIWTCTGGFWGKQEYCGRGETCHGTVPLKCLPIKDVVPKNATAPDGSQIPYSHGVGRYLA
ncbi:hypothetical protein DE146DRAFT_37413 [Phaeosphaeria sp. MPI-PUGE-AT-0046c]|nr:hypothetical protein DE146DRAFT_37413 [Phaeosphaeria sp. MPI-PUGE-AT-0046c]